MKTNKQTKKKRNKTNKQHTHIEKKNLFRLSDSEACLKSRIGILTLLGDARTCCLDI